MNMGVFFISSESPPLIIHSNWY